MKCTLDEILLYTNQPVINRFTKEYPEKKEKAQLLFKDLLRFFWSSQKHFIDQKNNPNNEELDFVFIMDEEMKDIDLMWHVFLLYTKDYMDFCDNYFGEYVHHLPDIVPNMPQDPIRFQKNLERFLSYCYDNLGAQTVKRWFAEIV